MIEMQCVISGRVQGVAYRTYVQDVACALGIVGYVRNLPNGEVEVLAQGNQSVLKELVEYLHEGSVLAKVEGVAVDWHSVTKPHDDFSILH